MVTLSSTFMGLAALLATASSAQADYNIHHMPHKTDAAHGQTGVNDCIKTYGASDPKSLCQTAVLNSVSEFCLLAPTYYAGIGDEEQRVVSYCTKSGFGTRLIPEGTILGAQFRKTPSYVQVTGLCNCKNINVSKKGGGGEMDPHGADGTGNPIGGVVFTNAYGTDPQDYIQLKEWSNFMGPNEFSFRGCRDGPNATNYCPHIYDEMGSEWNHPGRYEAGIFENCDATEGGFPGIDKNGHRWWQGHGPEPPPAEEGKTSNCWRIPRIRQRLSKHPPTQSRRRRSELHS